MSALARPQPTPHAAVVSRPTSAAAPRRIRLLRQLALAFAVTTAACAQAPISRWWLDEPVRFFQTNISEKESTLDAKRRRIELADARQRAEDELGRDVTHFAYPYGALDATVRESVAAAGYATACSTRPRLAGLRDDPLALPRLTMHGGEPLVSFGWRIRTGRGIGQTAGTVLKRLLGRAAHPSDP